jgi:hypothetical protein
MVVLNCNEALARVLGVSYAAAPLIPPGPVILVRPTGGKEWGVWKLDPVVRRDAEEIDRALRALSQPGCVPEIALSDRPQSVRAFPDCRRG